MRLWLRIASIGVAALVVLALVRLFTLSETDSGVSAAFLFNFHSKHVADAALHDLRKQQRHQQQHQYRELVADTGYTLHVPVESLAEAQRLVRRLNDDIKTTSKNPSSDGGSKSSASNDDDALHLVFYPLDAAAADDAAAQSSSQAAPVLSTSPLALSPTIGTATVGDVPSLIDMLSCGPQIEAEPGPQHAGAVYHALEEERDICRTHSHNNHFLWLVSDVDTIKQEQPAPGSRFNRDLVQNLLAMVHRFYPAYSPPVETLMGFSLAQPTFEQHTLGYRPVHPKMRQTNNFYTLQQPQTRGGMYHMPAISQYVRWYEARCRVLSPLPCSLNAHGEGSGLAALHFIEQGFFHMMTEVKLTLVYPPIDIGSTLLHTPPSSAPLNWPPQDQQQQQQQQQQRERRNAGESVRPSVVVSYQQLQHMLARVVPSELPVYNARRTYLHNGPARLFARDTEVLGRCTMVITVYDRYADVLNRLLFYHDSLNLRDIVVVWNAVNQPPVPVPAHDFYVPIQVLRQSRNSMNNRFRPLPPSERGPHSDCIVNMDDDWNMPHQVLFHGVRLWHHLYRDRLVGVIKLGRLHGRDEFDKSKWVYLKNTSMPQSMVLPSGMVYDAKYMHMYTHEVPAALREHVDNTINCDDLLMNFAVANRTKLPPAFVATKGVRRVDVIKQLGLDKGLWRRSKHYEDRDNCLNLFANAYGGMPLRYTTVQHVIDDHLGNPFPQRFNMDVENADSDEVVCTRCTDEKAVDDCVRCARRMPGTKPPPKQ
ncbi:ER-resident type II transmembrane glycosyltransferase [Salpingoeca rosetta]|uniref:ER-resident type II transmembrane glycosyltransferase n=1 Tax=Salpingoeca rosetta (strain ATCC 50818 / BSB-021) TaxID=946362 RepID=F2ULD9_SALR5|nr:ER-resident type II transmembrane glycosyltransferase [Salpingoeca rosetta]EGD77938.1 ER-resident type II transmembrane glycosyltransferase [Salpingoeca rosetta]|eukprot:XP_004990001.1 ER-resident type II transmembrane glycosyltransferase [Salpingoeca rosetta]